MTKCPKYLICLIIYVQGCLSEFQNVRNLATLRHSETSVTRTWKNGGVSLGEITYSVYFFHKKLHFVGILCKNLG